MQSNSCNCQTMKDCGPNPMITNLFEDTYRNPNFRLARWTGEHMQLTLMTIPSFSDIGMEIHPEVEQFLYVESGRGIAMMGKTKGKMDCCGELRPGTAILIPANTWHNIQNVCREELKLFSIYAPPQHPHGTVDVTKETERD